MIDTITRRAIQHTTHCLVGCGIGEFTGSAIGAGLGWPNLLQTSLAVALAFTFGYSLTFLGGRRMGLPAREAGRTALRTDTISIISMEIIDNSLEWLIPGAMNAVVLSGLFWWSNALSLAIAFALTVPVNRWLMSRSSGGHEHHMHGAMHEQHMHH